MELLRDLQDKQQKLDNFIYTNNNVKKEDIYFDKIIALDVELSEFANELEFFKYWRKNKGKDKALEEACDCLHFILSIANDLDVELTDTHYKVPYSLKDISYSYINLKNQVNRKFRFDINSIFNYFLNMLELAGLDFDDLVKEYHRKYEINIQRQNKGY